MIQRGGPAIDGGWLPRTYAKRRVREPGLQIGIIDPVVGGVPPRGELVPFSYEAVSQNGMGDSWDDC